MICKIAFGGRIEKNGMNRLVLSLLRSHTLAEGDLIYRVYNTKRNLHTIFNRFLPDGSAQKKFDIY
jgi:hypothetical protein